MIAVDLLLLILFIHLVGDFFMQSSEQAQNKWHSNQHLLAHVVSYTAALTIVSFIVFVNVPPMDPAKSALFMSWSLLNGALHFCVDWVTSRLTHHLFEKKKYHDGFAVIGVDQFAHYACLLLTWQWMCT